MFYVIQNFHLNRNYKNTFGKIQNCIINVEVPGLLYIFESFSENMPTKKLIRKEILYQSQVSRKAKMMEPYPLKSVPTKRLLNVMCVL